MQGNDTHGRQLSRRRVLGALGTLGTVTAGESVSTASAAELGSSAVYQYYHTDWNTIKSDLWKIADAGYDAIQIPPAQKSKLTRSDQDDDLHPPLGYQPLDHKNFNSVFGTEGEYRAMIDEAHRQGVAVIGDAVMNHMAAGVGFGRFPHFGYNDFHDGGEIDYDDPESVEKDDLSGLPDLKQESAYVRGQLREYVRKYADCGVDGLRFDAAKHMPEWFFKNDVTTWADNNGLYKVGEVLNGSKEVCDGYANTGMSVTDYPLYYTMKEDAFHSGGDLRALEDGGYVDWWSTRAMTFVSNHDSDPPEYEKLAYAYILTYEGYPRVYNRRIDINDGDIKNLLWIRNNIASGRSITRKAERDVYVFERESSLLVGLNRSHRWQTRWVKTSWNNKTLRDYSGSAGNVTVSGSWVQISIPPTGWVCYAP